MMWSKAVRKTVSRLTLKIVQRWGMILVIPLVATIVVVRQHVLHRTQDLSIWKGGGMGMFASSDSVSRYTKIYIVTPEGDRHPIVKLTPHQNKLLSGVLNNPSDNNFLRLADDIRRTRWFSSKEKFSHRIIDKTGKLISAQRKKYHYLKAGAPRQPDNTPGWKLLIEFWKARYDPGTRLARAELAKTFTFPQE